MCNCDGCNESISISTSNIQNIGIACIFLGSCLYNTNTDLDFVCAAGLNPDLTRKELQKVIDTVLNCTLSFKDFSENLQTTLSVKKVQRNGFVIDWRNDKIDSNPLVTKKMINTDFHYYQSYIIEIFALNKLTITHNDFVVGVVGTFLEDLLWRRQNLI